MSALTPQQTGTPANIGSRNPFLHLLTPDATGTSSTGNHASSRENASPLSPAPPTPPPKTAPLERETAPKLEPQRTGILNSPSIANSSSPPRILLERAASMYSPPAGPPPPLPPRNTPSDSNSSHMPRTPPRNSTLDILQEELPPEYTPGPDAYAGEQSIDFGPIRPFQDANSRPAHPTTQPAGSSYFPQQSFGPARSGTGTSPGSLRQALGSLLLAALAEPPRRSPGSSVYRTQPGLRQSPAPHGVSIPSQPSAPHAPYGAPRPPAPPQPSTSRGWSQYPGQRPAQRQRSLTPEPQPRAPDDGKPTVRPTPGHPLLRDGKVIVYPLGHECRKCFNKGFRPVHASTFDSTPRALAPGDPSHPCKGCWRHYSRPYTSVLAQLNWKEAVETNFQRPISDPDVVSQSAVSFSSPMGHAPSNPPVRSPPPNFGLGYPGQGAGGPRQPMHWMQSTPTGSAVYEPGDPRIGGRLCPRCHGSGRTRVFILETESCNLCRGIGRVF